MRRRKMKSAIEVERIIEEKYYTKIQKIINEYLKENKNLFCFKDYYFESIWIDVELIQQNWEIIAFSCKECEDELILKMLMKVSIKGMENYDYGYDLSREEKLFVKAKTDKNYENIEFMYINIWLGEFV